MAPSPSPERRVRLHVSAGSPLAEVFLVGHDFALVDRAVGDLDSEVAPGVYKVKATLGDALTEKMVVLDSDATLDLSGALTVASPAPLAGTARAPQPARATADRLSAEAPAREGVARVFVMARAWTGRGAADAVPPEVSLHRPDGEVVAVPGPLPGGDAGTHTVTVEVEPGPYFLRWVDESGVTGEQCVHTVDGWQTQVFVLEEGVEPEELGRTRISILMGRDGFDSGELQLRRVEEARTALASERLVAAGFLNTALPEELTNPMLALFGAHLMLIARDKRRTPEPGRPDAPVTFEQERFDAVVGALRELLGAAHPDVVALSTQASGTDPGTLPPVAAPPMLWRSWVLLIEASNEAPALVPVETWRRTVKLLPLRPFLLWSPEDEEPTIGEEWKAAVERALATAKREPDAPRPPGAGGPLASMLASGAAEAAEPGGVEAGEETRRRVSRELLAPRAAIDQLAEPPAS